MKRLQAGFLVAVVCCAGAACAQPSQSPQPSMKLHRQQAGTPDAGGWSQATSTPAGFSASLPCRFNDFSVHEPGAQVPDAHSLGCARPDGTRWSVTRVSYRDGAADAERFFARSSSGSAWPGARARKFDFQGRPAADLSIETGGQCGFVRYVLARPYTYVMTIEAPKGACASLEPLRARFFDSLAIPMR